MQIKMKKNLWICVIAFFWFFSLSQASSVMSWSSELQESLSGSKEKVEDNQQINPIEDFRQRQQKIIDSIYENEDANFLQQVNWARDRVDMLSDELQLIIRDFENLKDRKEITNERYFEIRNSISNTLQSMRKAEDNMKDRLIKVNLQTRRIWILQEQILELNDDIKDTKKEIEEYTRLLYRINNDFYWQWMVVDEIKLLVRSDNIVDWLSGEEIIRSLVIRMDDLMESMERKKSMYINYSDTLNDLRQENALQVRKYQDEIETYKQQRQHLQKLMEFVRQDRQNLDSEYENLFNNKETVQNRIQIINERIMSDWSEEAFDWAQLSKLFQHDERPDEWNFFSWPVNDIQRISAFYDDPRYKREHWTDHLAVDLVVEQWKEVYAPANSLVYHVVDQDWPWLNWMVMVHKHWYVTVYLHMQDIFVEEWDFVKRWEIVWLVWGKPWTRWAWLMSSWPHLHFEVLKNWEYIDPLKLLDLSIFPSPNAYPPLYRDKYINDLLDRGTDISNITKLEWSTVEERRKEYLQRNGFGHFNDLSIWEDAADNLNVDIDLWICIGAAESWLWRNLTTAYNVWNVWNNDRWDRRGYNSPTQWARVIYLTLTNQYLWDYTKLSQLSRYWNEDWSIYASSDYNWQNNVIRCLSSIKWYWVPDDYFFRRYIWENQLVLSSR